MNVVTQANSRQICDNESAPASAGNTPRGLTRSSGTSREGLAMDASSKRCSSCKAILPRTEFNRNRSRKDGLSDACRKCRSLKRSHSGYSAAYWQKNRDRLVEKQAEYRAVNPEPFWRGSYKHRCLAFGIDPVVENFTRSDVVNAYGGSCVYCGGPFEQLDHFVAVVDGGHHTLANVRPSCAECNLAKSVQERRTPEWWAKAVRLALEGHSLESIGRELEMNGSSVHHALHAQGLSFEDGQWARNERRSTP